MLLPSGISFDSDHNEPSNRFHGNLVSPPHSPPQTPTHTISSIFSTCRALQSILTTASNQLPTPVSSPPLLNSPAPLSTPKFRLQPRSSRKPTSLDPGTEVSFPIRKMKVAKRPAVPRGMNKRCRSINDDGGQKGRPFHCGLFVEDDKEKVEEAEAGNMLDCPSTPKRSRIAPETLPFGLTRSDFHDAHLKSIRCQNRGSLPLPPPPSTLTTTPTPITSSSSSSPAFTFTYPYPYPQPPTSPPSSTPPTPADATSPPPPPPTEEEEWSLEDDKMLIELVLEKLHLSKSDWQDCAQSLGRDSSNVGKRWKSLMTGGEIGLKSGSNRRSRLFHTWR